VTIRSSLICTLVVATTLLALGLLGPIWGAALGLAIIANQIHKWSHVRSIGVPRLVRWLQAAWLLQTPAHHAWHHGGDKNSRYCVITNVVNPVLDAVGLWRGLEFVISVLTGARPRAELSPRVV
jgi:ubiquitin-conjugating enzyme E2 variant